MAVTILNVGILAIVGTFASGAISLRRARRISTGSALAGAQMELYRGVAYSSIALDSTSVSSAPGRAAGDYKCGDSFNTTKVYVRQTSTFDQATG